MSLDSITTRPDEDDPRYSLRCTGCGAKLHGGDLGTICAACLLDAAIGDGLDDEPRTSESGCGFFVPGHEVLQEVAAGGMGVVYRARQLEPPREVALKMLLPAQGRSAELQERFRTEARAAAAFEHPAILPIFAFGEQDGLPWFTMKFAAGGNLAAKREAFGGQFRRTATLLATLADALQHAHDRGVLHRDIKPSNVLFDADERPYLCDFGLAKFVGGEVETDLTPTSTTMGTPRYLAPEATRGARHALIASDVYGLGAVLYELLSGQAPFTERDLPRLLRDIAEKPPQPPTALRPDVPRDLEIICLKCLRKDPAQRYSSAGALRDDLTRWLEHRPISARPVSLGESALQFSKRNPILTLLALALVLAMASGGWLQLRSNRRLGAALRDTMVNEATALRRGGEIGWRQRSLGILERASRLGEPSPGLRDEFIAALASYAIEPGPRWPTQWETSNRLIRWLPGLDVYVTFDPVQADSTDVDRGGEDPGFEIRFHSVEARRVLRRFGSYRSRPRSLTVSPDAGWLGLQFHDAPSRVVRASDGVSVWEHPDPDGDLVIELLGADRGLVYGRTGEGLYRVAIPPGTEPPTLVLSPEQLRRHASAVRTLAGSPDGRLLALGRDDGIELWSVENPRPVWRTPVEQRTGDLTWDETQTRLATASEASMSVIVFDAADGRPLRTLIGHIRKPRSIAFHPLGRWLVSAGWDHQLRLWDIDYGYSTMTIVGPPVPIRFALFPQPGVPDAHRMALATGADELGFIDFMRSSLFGSWGAMAVPEETSQSLGQTADGSLVLHVTSGRFLLGDARVGSRLHEEPVRGQGGVAPKGFIDGTGQSVWLAGTEHGALKIPLRQVRDPGGSLRVELGERRRVDTDPSVLLHQVEARGRFVTASRLDPETQGYRIEIWTNGLPTEVRVVGRIPSLHTCVVSPDGRWAAATTRTTQSVRFWNLLRSDTDVRFLPIPSSSHLAFSGDGRWLVVATATGHVLVSTDTGDEVAVSVADLGAKGGGLIAFSNDGKRVALEQTGGRVKIVSVPGFQERYTLIPPMSLDLSALQFNPDGRFLQLAGNGRIQVWHLRNVRKELVMAGLVDRSAPP